MLNLNDIMFDDKPYSTRGNNRDDSSYIISDTKLIKLLQNYNLFEKEIIENIKDKKTIVYLRFCDGEYIYYSKKNIIYYIKGFVKKILGKKEITSRGESMVNNLSQRHFEFFEKNGIIIKFCPMFSESRIKGLKRSKLYEILLNQKEIGHLYYVYHFLNKLRQGKIERLKDLNICYVTNKKYIPQYKHIEIGPSYEEEYIQKLANTDFSKYDLILLGGGISSPLYANEIIKTAKCPIVDSGYMLSIRNNENIYNEGPYTHKI